mmetsp:Transcript_7630/g.17978  ORF Transcript_7630/g.17978 Transcript_7630/m.17978 type:complete len:244 (+) Transcript_7630:264-995(+)
MCFSRQVFISPRCAALSSAELRVNKAQDRPYTWCPCSRIWSCCCVKCSVSAGAFSPRRRWSRTTSSSSFTCIKRTSLARIPFISCRRESKSTGFCLLTFGVWAPAGESSSLLDVSTRFKSFPKWVSVARCPSTAATSSPSRVSSISTSGVDVPEVLRLSTTSPRCPTLCASHCTSPRNLAPWSLIFLSSNASSCCTWKCSSVNMSLSHLGTCLRPPRLSRSSVITSPGPLSPVELPCGGAIQT